jgi:hypothetical protein
MMTQYYTYQPKGGMCANCQYRLNDCSALPFDKMKIIEIENQCDVKIVRCDDFLRIEYESN